MSACATQSFNNVSSSAWTCLIQKAAGYGITIGDYKGQASKDGFTLTWNYDPNAQTLELQCTDSPWWASCGMINGKIHDLVEGCM
ncbi:MAG TPA: hypothetical protein VF723_13480 [Pyrinomonadaceae bacterium]|jgi:hypothetical protein